MAVLLPSLLLLGLAFAPGLHAQSNPCAGNTASPCACPKPSTSTLPTKNTPDCYNPLTRSCPNPPPDSDNGVTNVGDLRNNDRSIGCGLSKGDPLIKGFSGCTWYLNGKPDTVMNLITEANHVVNTLLVPANLTDEHHGGDGTFHGSISVRYQDTVVTSTVDAQGNLTVLLDGKPVPFEASRVRQDLTVKTARNYPYFGQIAEIVTPAFRFFIHAVQPYDSPAGWNRGHLDFTASTLAMQPNMHGLLGQASNKAGEVCNDDFSFHGEGQEQDYVLTSLDSVDYIYSQFISQKTTRRLQAARTLYQPTSTRMVAGTAQLAQMA